MIEIAIDGLAIDPQLLALHSQDSPIPGGHRYRLFCCDKEMATFFHPRFSSEALPLSVTKAAHLFNMLRMYIDLHADRAEPLYWANTVDKLNITDDRIEIEGERSAHSSSHS